MTSRGKDGSVFLRFPQGERTFRFTSLIKPLQDDEDPGTLTTPAVLLTGQTPAGGSCEHLKYSACQKRAF